MNTTLLLKWLDLPPGPWPPEDRTLLGLPPGKIDPVSAELRALALMEKLRPHQLVHPDLVTEGMNRLAQALISATSAPAAPFFPEVNLEPEAPPTPAPAANVPPVAPLILEAEVVAAVQIVDAEVVKVRKKPGTKVAKALPVARAATLESISLPLPPEPPPIAPDLPPLPASNIPPTANRRAIYRQLAALRQYRRAWDTLRPSVGIASNLLLTPADVCEFLEAISTMRTALAVKALPPIDPESPGKAVRGVVSHPLALSVMRSLIPTQRQALAWDWAIGDAAIRQQAASIRAGLKQTRPARSFRQKRVAVAGWIGRNPEWVLVVLTLAALLTAVLRTVTSN